MLSTFSITRIRTFQPGYILLNSFYIFHMDHTTTDISKVTQDIKSHYILPLKLSGEISFPVGARAVVAALLSA
jgi:hypothetical protein